MFKLVVLPLLLLSACLLFSQCAAKHTQRQSDVGQMKKKNGREWSSTPYQEITKRHRSGEYRSQRDDEGDEDTRHSEPILDELFDNFPSHKRTKCTHKKPLRKVPCNHEDAGCIKSPSKKYDTNAKLPLPRRRTFDRDFKRVLVSLPLQLMTGKHPSQSLSHIEKYTKPDSESPDQIHESPEPDDELIQLAVMQIRGGWKVLEKEGGESSSSHADVEKVLDLREKEDLPFTYRDYSELHNQPEVQVLHPYIVLNSDTRTKVPAEDLTKEPYSSVAMIGDNRCTGAFIGPRHVLTSAQCLYSTAEREWHKSNDVRLHKGCDPDTGVLYHWKKAVIPRGFTFFDQEAVNYNFGMIIVEPAIPEPAIPAHTVLNFGWKDTQIQNTLRPKVSLVGYPEVPGQCMWRDSCDRIDLLDDRVLEHHCDVMEGDTGAPVFFRLTESPVITCIQSHVTIASDFGPNEVEGSFCLRITDSVFSSLVVWMEKY